MGIGWGSVLALLLIGFFYTHNMTWQIRFGGILFVRMTLVQFVVGLGFLFSLEEPYRSAFLGGNSAATTLLMGGILFALVAMGCFVWAMLSPRPAFPVVGWTGAFFLTIVLMALVRDRLRLLALEPYLEPNGESYQTGVIVLFFLFFFGALAIVGWMLDAAAKSAQAPT